MEERPIIRVGDPTSHGGVVVEGFTNYWVHDQPAAGLGHRVTCPICPPGIHVIVEGSELCLVGDVPLAYEGALTSCGAVLVATQHTASVETRAGSGVAFGSTVTAAGALPKSPAATHDQHFQLFDEASDEPLANRRYRITIDGKAFEGMTDAQGRTKLVSAGAALRVQLEVWPEGA